MQGACLFSFEAGNDPYSAFRQKRVCPACLWKGLVPVLKRERHERHFFCTEKDG